MDLKFTAPADCVSLEEFANRVGFSVPTVRRRIKDGLIRVWQPGGPGTRLSIPLSEIARLLHQPADAPEPMAAPAANVIPGRLPLWKQQLHPSPR